MDTSPIPGFITRKQASERCKRAERTLQRYWSRAVEYQENKILQRLRLRTEDGQVIDGRDVTKELIDKLKKSRKNPTWYVHGSWVARTYGPRLEKDATEPQHASDNPAGDSEPQPMAAHNTHLASLLNKRIQELERDKQELRDELKIKNDQIKEANERNKETHVLMRDLHELLRDMQHRLPAPSSSDLPLTGGGQRAQPSDAEPLPDAVVVTKPQIPKAQKGIRRVPKKAARSSARPTRRRKTTKSTKQKTAIKQPQTAFKKNTPTLHRALAALFRRSR